MVARIATILRRVHHRGVDGITIPPGLQDALDDLLPPRRTIEADLEREVADESRFLISA